MEHEKKIMIGIVFAWVMLVFIASASTEIPVKQWGKTYGGPTNDWAASVIQTSDGGYIIAGSSESRSGTFCYDIWIVKTDSSGNKDWSKTFGGDNNEHAYSVIQTSDGGYAIAGTTESKMDWSVFPSPTMFGEDEDIWLIKIGSSGNKEWDKMYGGAKRDSVHSVIQTSDGGYAIAGDTWVSNNSWYDGWLIKTDSSGNVKWNKTYGGSGTETAYSVVQTSDGGYAIAGDTSDFGGNFWLVKTDSFGNVEWNRTYGGIGNECAWEMIQTSDGGYALAGLKDPISFGNGSRDFWVVKTDSFGNEEWNRTYGSQYRDEARAMVQTSDSGYILVGETGSDAWLVKIDSCGNEEWNEIYGGPDVDKAQSVIQTSDNGYVFAGMTGSKDYRGGDFWLVKVGGSMEKQPLGKEKAIPGFEIIFVIAGLLAVTYLFIIRCFKIWY